MVTFFRKIRKSLFSNESGSIRRYLMYAVGEILLVMIGILLALQVNNWNQERIFRNQEKLLLAEIHNEFIYNLEEFNANLSKYGDVRSRLERIMDLFPIDLKSLNLDTLDYLLSGTHFSGNYDFSKESIEKIRSTTSYDIISDENLKNLMIKWEVILADYTEMEIKMLNHLEERFNPIINDQIPRPYSRGLRDTRANLNYLSSIPFESLIRSRHSKIDNLFRITERVADKDNIVKVMEKIIELSSNNKK